MCTSSKWDELQPRNIHGTQSRLECLEIHQAPVVFQHGFSLLLEGKVEIPFALLSVLLVTLVLNLRIYSNAIDLVGYDLSLMQMLCLFMCNCVCENARWTQKTAFNWTELWNRPIISLSWGHTSQEPFPANDWVRQTSNTGPFLGHVALS